MDNFLHITAVWMHILGIALFVGPQFFLAFAWIPASRRIADLPTRVDAMRTITRRFGYIGGIGLALIITAGVYMIATWRDFYAQPDDLGFTDIRYGVIFILKMNVLIVMLALVAIHTFYIGPKQLALMDERARGVNVDEARIVKWRKISMMVSILTLLLTLGIMVMGVSMSTTNYSFQAS